jgi:hypothetical protein
MRCCNMYMIVNATDRKSDNQGTYLRFFIYVWKCSKAPRALAFGTVAVSEIRVARLLRIEILKASRGILYGTTYSTSLSTCSGWFPL